MSVLVKNSKKSFIDIVVKMRHRAFRKKEKKQNKEKNNNNNNTKTKHANTTFVTKLFKLFTWKQMDKQPVADQKTFCNTIQWDLIVH